MAEDTDDPRIVPGVSNHEGPSSVGPAEGEPPAGWEAAGRRSSKAKGHEDIHEVGPTSGSSRCVAGWEPMSPGPRVAGGATELR